MADVLHALIQSEARRLLKDDELLIVVDAAFGAAAPDHRTHLRRSILQTVENLGLKVEDPAPVLDLSRPLLRVGIFHVSIAHSIPLGGFALSKNPVGFDLEEASRVETRTVARVSVTADLNEAPHPAWLWTAKESAFKALQHAEKSPELLSQIEIGDWVLTGENSQSGTFSVRNLSGFSSRAALGCVIQAEEMIASTFSITP